MLATYINKEDRINNKFKSKYGDNLSITNEKSQKKDKQEQQNYDIKLRS